MTEQNSQSAVMPPVFDSHMHIVDPAYPLVANNGYLPEPFTADDYERRITGLGIAGGAIVSGSFQAFDQTYLVAALERFGPSYVGVAQIPPTMSDAEILGLHEAGVRAIRLNAYRGGSEALAGLETIARRVHDLAGWHVEFYLDSRSLDDGLIERLSALPRIVIDHLGMSAEGLPALLRLVERGAKVKATGFGRVELDPAVTMRAIMDVNPGALMIGTDLPSPRARRPFENADFEIAREVLEPGEIPLVFWENAAELYLSTPRS